MHVKHAAGELDDRVSAGPRSVVSGVVRAGWRRLAVLTVDAPKQRLFVLEPAAEEASPPLTCGPFYVRGRYRITDRINNPREAREAWKAFTPE